MVAWVVAMAVAVGQFSQANTGELRLTVTDQAGLPLQTVVELISEANRVRDRHQTDTRGTLIARRLPFGTYRMAITCAGFAEYTTLVDVRSALPTELRVTMTVAPILAAVEVRPEDTLIDPHQTTTVHRIGAETLQARATAIPGRSLPDLVNTQPGWLLEANGILHPRGSEYQTQYVIDGLPLTDNRSPTFAPEIDPDVVRALTVRTGGYPAEYGRKLGGVIEVVTAATARQGFHGRVSAGGGSFATKLADAVGEYGWPAGTLSVSGGIADTERYLDPPVEENFTNRGTTSRAAVHFERDVSSTDRIGLILRHGLANFQVPDEQLQEEAGQRQDRSSRETSAQVSYQRIVSPRLLADVRGMARFLSAGLWSNEQSTPIVASQDRTLRDVYVKGAVSGHAGEHEWKAGGDAVFGSVREFFAYRVSDPRQFSPDTRAAFQFSDSARNAEQALFVQDQLRRGDWTVNAGLRWDHYSLIVDEHAVSPRIAVARAWPRSNLVVRASYDRAFQTPAIENLLLASSADVDTISPDVLRLPVKSSRGDFFEAGFTKGLGGRLRLDASIFARKMHDFADDDVLLNTGVSFPIAFSRARISGAELKLEIPRWRALSGFVSYSNLHGTGELPVTGGLFLGDDAAEILTSRDVFAITQDQRHTIRGRFSVQMNRSSWAALAMSYGSGLPFEFSGDENEALEQYGSRIVNRVNFASGRVRSNVDVDASAAVTLGRSASRQLKLQADVRNVTNRLNVINFAGVFSGTALAPPRSISIRLVADF